MRSAVRGSEHETILVVEDDEDVRSYSTESLRELGYTVVEAANARAALQVLEAPSRSGGACSRTSALPAG